MKVTQNLHPTYVNYESVTQLSLAFGSCLLEYPSIQTFCFFFKFYQASLDTQFLQRSCIKVDKECATFQVPTAVLLKIKIWDVMACRLAYADTSISKDRNASFFRVQQSKKIQFLDFYNYISNRFILFVAHLSHFHWMLCFS